MDMTEVRKREKKIAIIGAGAAGLAAARKLKSHGFQEVKIYEAAARIGGRIHTVHYGSHALDLGAQWIHGETGNSVFALAKENDLINAEAPSYMDALLDFSKSGVSVTESAYSNAAAFFGNEIDLLSEIKCNELKEKYGKTVSLGEYLTECCDKYLTIPPTASECRMATYTWFCQLQRELNGCSDLNFLSLVLYPGYKECEGLQTVELVNGYSSILNIFLKDIPSNWIILNKNVCKIDWTNASEGGIKIMCTDETAFTADHVIVTVSLGCLKKQLDTMFEPRLSDKKIDAVMCTGFGTVNKIYLMFEESFWNMGDIMNVLWTHDLDQKCKEMENFISYHSKWFKDISRFAYVLNQPKVLCAWITGESAVHMEHLSDETIKFTCHFLLKRLLRREDLPMPVEILKSSWASNEFARGSYSYPSIMNAAAESSFNKLAEPMFHLSEHGKYPAILFAGEATHPHFYSTVHGAIDSGIREAERIIEYYEHSELLNVPEFLVRKVDIVIVGAGVAGLTCAQHLIKSGLNDIVVLEAADRVGGRIWTIDHETSVLELGAQWIHGEENLLFEYCNEYNLLETIECSNEGKGVFCTSDGKIISQCIVNEMLEVIESLRERINTCDSCLSQSVEEIFENYFEEYLSRCIDTLEETTFKKGVFDWFKRFEIIDNACDDLRDLSVLSYKNWVDCPGLYHTDLKKGFCSFITHLINTVPSDIIKKSKPVKCIHWKKNVFQMACQLSNERSVFESPIVVECEDGEYFAAQNVVITPSVGFLKENMHSFFHPNLPNVKASTFENIGFGTINKIFLVFEKGFWSQDDQGFQLVWTTSSSRQKFCNPEESWVFGITGFDRVRNLPNVLMVWIGGIQSKQMEKRDCTSVGRTCTHLLRQFLNNPEIPYPIQVIRSSWHQNPYTKGSYSNLPRKFFDSGCKIKDLKEPLYCNVILHNGTTVQWPAVIFAGEAFDAKYFSSVHGAMESGTSESQRIIKFYRELQKL